MTHLFSAASSAPASADARDGLTRAEAGDIAAATAGLSAYMLIENNDFSAAPTLAAEAEQLSRIRWRKRLGRDRGCLHEL